MGGHRPLMKVYSIGTCRGNWKLVIGGQGGLAECRLWKNKNLTLSNPPSNHHCGNLSSIPNSKQNSAEENKCCSVASDAINIGNATCTRTLDITSTPFSPHLSYKPTEVL